MLVVGIDTNKKEMVMKKTEQIIVIPVEENEKLLKIMLEKTYPVSITVTVQSCQYTYEITSKGLELKNRNYINSGDA
jgi:hypothetical protein